MHRKPLQLQTHINNHQKARQSITFGWLSVFVFAFVTLASSSLHAQILEMVAVGDSTQFDAWALAAHAASGANNNFTFKGFTPNLAPYAAMLDTRNAAILPQEGSVWIIWDNTPPPNTRIWAYLSMDAIAAVRGFDAVPRALLLLNPAIVGPAGLNLVPGLPPDAPALPAAIFNDLSAPSATFNAAMTGVTAANALAQTKDLLAALGVAPTQYGYGPAPFNLTVSTPFNALLQRQPVLFATAGKDPITKLAVPKTLQQAMGKSLLVPFVNATDLGAGGIGNIIGGGLHDAAVPCAPANGLAEALNGNVMTNGLLSSAGPGVPLTVFLDAPLSGGWYFMEHNVMNTCVAPNNSQELAVNPVPGPPGDPLNQLGPGGSRERVIGQGMAVAMVGATKDSLSYTLWTCPLAGLTTYLTVGTQNPWAGAWTGVFPACPIKQNPKYPLQVMQFVITNNPAPPAVAALIPAVKALAPHTNWP